MTEADYAEVSERNRDVQRAAATFRWTGSWHTVFVTADRSAAECSTPQFETTLRTWLEKYRMAGYDLEVDSPVFVPLEVGLHVCVVPGQLRSDVATEVRARLLGLGAARRRPRPLPPRQPHVRAGGVPLVGPRRGALRPGVQSVDVVTFQRQREPESSGIDTGLLPMGRLEIARLDNDPNFPERGVLDLTFGGGL